MPQIALIAAMDENRLIGRDNVLPWDLPADWENFKRVTAGHAFIMGRKSHESPHALHSERRNVILSRNKMLSLPEGCERAESLAEAIEILKDEKLIFVLGGTEVFAHALPFADYLYLTLIHHAFSGNIYFPKINWENWTLIESKSHSVQQKQQFTFSINIYSRKA